MQQTIQMKLTKLGDSLTNLSQSKFHKSYTGLPHRTDAASSEALSKKRPRPKSMELSQELAIHVKKNVTAKVSEAHSSQKVKDGKVSQETKASTPTQQKR